MPLPELLADENKGALFRHRLALAARCLPEIDEVIAKVPDPWKFKRLLNPPVADVRWYPYDDLLAAGVKLYPSVRFGKQSSLDGLGRDV